MKKPLLCGIDVSARDLAVAIDNGTGRIWEGTFPNDPTGHRKLVRRLSRGPTAARVVVEATGIYHLDLCLALHDAKGIAVMVANPRTTKDFARAQLRRSKTDRTDAQSLLEFVRRMEFESWAPPKPSILALRAFSRRIQALLVTRAQEKNRLHADASVAATPPAIRESIERHIESINGEIEALTRHAIEVVAEEEDLVQRFAHLVSVKGIAQASAITLLAELSVLPNDMSAREWVAHAGLDPPSSRVRDLRVQRGTNQQGRQSSPAIRTLPPCAGRIPARATRPRLLCAAARARQEAHAGPGGRDAETSPRHSRNVPSRCRLRRSEVLRRKDLAEDGVSNAPVQRRAAQRTVRCNRLLGGSPYDHMLIMPLQQFFRRPIVLGRQNASGTGKTSPTSFC